MIVVIDDHLDELEQMKAEGMRCMSVASERGDQHGFMLWQRSVEKIETLLCEPFRQLNR